MNGFETTEYIRKYYEIQNTDYRFDRWCYHSRFTKMHGSWHEWLYFKTCGWKETIFKIIDLYKKSKEMNDSVIKVKDEIKTPLPKNTACCIDLTYLNTRTKSNRKLMMEMIGLYLEQTPPLVIKLKTKFAGKRLGSLYAAVHKMIPSFLSWACIRIWEHGKKNSGYASTKQNLDKVPKLVLQLETICLQACKELEIEFDLLKKTNWWHTKKKILLFLVDDDALFLKSLEIEFAQKMDSRIKTFATGELCLNDISQNPDLIILDYYLDGVDKNAINGLEPSTELK